VREGFCNDRRVTVRHPTDAETRIFGALSSCVGQLQDWYHVDPDGSPWMMVSYDFVGDRGIVGTLRCDWDGAQLLGGWSPAFLNWDAEVRAGAAGVTTTPPDGLQAAATEPETAAAIAAAWFAQHISSGPSGA
jgi:hypothetical protein